MNVLVYSGPEVLQSSASRVLSSLRSVLYPNYTVQAITLQSLSAAPWSTSCALLVFPACRQHLSLPANAVTSVKAFVESGGSFLGIRAGMRLGGSLLGGVGVSDHSFRFQDPATGLSVYCTFAYGEDRDSRVVSVKQPSQDTVVPVLRSQEAQFHGVEETIDAQVIARYANGDAVAAAWTAVGPGKVALWAPHIEASITAENSELATNEARLADEQRQKAFSATLQELGLKLPSAPGDEPSHPLPQFLVGSPSRPDVVSSILKALSLNLPGQFKDTYDTFDFHAASEALLVLQRARQSDGTDAVRHVVAYTDGTLPSADLTPSFDIQQFYDDLSASRHREGTSLAPNIWDLGDALFFGEAVTSTQTLFDKNPRFLSALPSPLVSLATHQLAGRGRSGNVWVSPKGCLQFSVRLRVSKSQYITTRLAFIQYLFALAVVEACKDESVLGPYGDRVRIKWPNDIYIVGDENSKTKVAGILVHTSFLGDDIDLVIGCGLNVLNPPPIASLASLVPPGTGRVLSLERTLAIIMTKFEALWTTSVSHQGSFEPFVDLYLENWLHSDQVVTLTNTTPHRRVRIVGITTDHGLLRTIPVEGGQNFIDLQPDGNTFDLMSGLIMTKTR